MLKRIVILLMVVCSATLACGKVQVACAQWTSPPIIIQQPRFQPSQPQQIQTLPNNFLQPTIKALPSAPQAITGNANGNAGIVGGSENPATEPVRTEPHPTPALAKEPESPPVAVEKTAPVPVSEPSNPKTPWLLVAGVVIAAFLIGRRTT